MQDRVKKSSLRKNSIRKLHLLQHKILKQLEYSDEDKAAEESHWSYYSERSQQNERAANQQDAIVFQSQFDEV